VASQRLPAQAIGGVFETHAYRCVDSTGIPAHPFTVVHSHQRLKGLRRGVVGYGADLNALCLGHVNLTGFVYLLVRSIWISLTKLKRTEARKGFNFSSLFLDRRLPGPLDPARGATQMKYQAQGRWMPNVGSGTRGRL